MDSQGEKKERSTSLVFTALAFLLFIHALFLLRVSWECQWNEGFSSEPVCVPMFLLPSLSVAHVQIQCLILLKIHKIISYLCVLIAINGFISFYSSSLKQDWRGLQKNLLYHLDVKDLCL